MKYKFFKKLNLSQDNSDSEKNINQILTEKIDIILIKILEQKNN